MYGLRYIFGCDARVCGLQLLELSFQFSVSLLFLDNDTKSVLLVEEIGAGFVVVLHTFVEADWFIVYVLVGV